MVKAEIDTKDLMRLIDKAPDKMLKAVKATYRIAGRASAKDLRSATSRRFRSLITSKVGKLPDGDLSAAVGYFKGKGHVKDGSTVDDWFKAYWRNYGTLSNRDPGHHFVNPRKAQTRNWKGGITPSGEFEAAKAGAQERFRRTVEEEFPKQFEKEFDL